MELRVLGAIEVRHDGSPVMVRGTKPRELLALLAIRPNRPVTAEQLVDELWRCSPPPSAATALRVHIGRLREALEPGRSSNSPSARLPAVPYGYVLRIEPDELDAQHFERLVLLAREAIAAGDPAGAVPQLTQALDLWRGSALAEIEDIAAARGEIARLEDLRAVAIEELANARLELGEHALVVDLITAALTHFPLRERLTASLMVALYRSGRQAEALHAYAEFAHRLDELGLAPSPGLRRLEEDVLLHRPSMNAVRLRKAARPMPRMRTPIGRFIGRRSEISRLLDAHDVASAGTSNLILVSGAAGVGKTTLTEEFCARVERRGSGPLVGRCDSEPGAEYQPVVQILRQVVERLDSRSRSALPCQLGLVLPDLIDGTPARDDDRDGGGDAQFRLFEAIATTLATLVEQPRVLIVEDVHWADRPTLRLLRHLVRHRELDGTLVIATFRDDEIDGERTEIIEQLARSAQRTKIDLTGFDDHEIRALVRATAPPETLHVLVDLAATLHDVTGGNPFFLRELLRELDEQFVKLESTEQLSDTLTTIAPVGVRALVDRRRERLSVHADRVIKAAATLGRELTVDVLAGICRQSKEVTLEALEDALATRLLIEDYQQVDRYLFPHTLVRNVVYATIPVAERRQLHRRVAEALEGAAIPGWTRRSADIAHHYLEAPPLPGLQRKAAAYSEQAGEDAASSFAFAEAARLYEQALALRAAAGTPDDETGRLHLALGRALTNDKQHERAQHALLTAAECARRSRDPILLAEVALTADNPWALGADYHPDVLALLEEALAAVDEGDIELRVRLLDGMATNLYYIDAERERRVAQTALELAERIDSPAALAAAHRSMHLWYTHQPEARKERLAAGCRAHELACSAHEAIRLRLVAHRGLVVDLLENQEIDEFETTLLEYEEAAHSLGSPQDIYWAMALRTTETTMHGDLDAAEQLARGAMLRGHELDQISDGAYLLQRFVVRYQQARLAEEAPVLREASAASTVYRAGAALHAIALVETGQPKRAMEIARTTLEPDGSGLPRDAFWLAGVSLFAGVAATAGDRELSELLQELLTPCADHVVLFGAGAAMLGAGHQWLGGLAATLRDTDAALEHFAEARAIAQRLRAPYWIAQSAVDAASARRARDQADDDAKADRLLAEAIAIAETYGYGRVLKQAKRFC